MNVHIAANANAMTAINSFQLAAYESPVEEAPKALRIPYALQGTAASNPKRPSLKIGHTRPVGFAGGGMMGADELISVPHEAQKFTLASLLAPHLVHFMYCSSLRFWVSYLYFIEISLK